MSEQVPNVNGVNRELAIRGSDQSWADAVDRLKYATDYAQGGLKGLFLANGAAIVSSLTFLGNTKETHLNPIGVWWAFFWFSIGLAAVLFAYILGYVAHASYMQAAIQYSRQADRAAHNLAQQSNVKSFDIYGGWAENVGIALASCSLIAFVIGAFVALDAIR